MIACECVCVCMRRWDVLGHKVAVDIATGLNHLHRQNPPLMHRVRISHITYVSDTLPTQIEPTTYAQGT